MTVNGLPGADDREPPVLQGFWHGPPLGALRRACLGSFVRLGYNFELYTYGPVDAPPGIVIRDAAEIIPLRDVFYFDNPEWTPHDLGPFSDLFRFKLLAERGGWWIDVDTICISPAIPSVDRAWSQQIPEVNPKAVGTGQIAFGKGDALVLELYSRCLALSRTAFRPREALGPHLLSSVIAEWRLPPNVNGRPETFYPLRFIEMFKLWLPEFRGEVEDKARCALFLPVFQSFPQYIGLGACRLPPPGSYLGEFCREYCVDYDLGPHYKSDDVRRGTASYLNRHRGWAIDELTAVCGDSILATLGLESLPATR